MLRLLTALALMTTAAHASDILEEVKQVNNVRYADVTMGGKWARVVLFDRYDGSAIQKICDISPEITTVFVAPLEEFNKAHRDLADVPITRMGQHSCES